MNICFECGDECGTHQVDFGIGAYEHHGYRGFDSQIETVSDCCESEYSNLDE